MWFFCNIPIIFILLILMGTLNGNVQDAKPLRNTCIKIADLSSMVYFGFKLGMEKPCRVKQINKTKCKPKKLFYAIEHLY
jgi:hypothetical protein